MDKLLAYLAANPEALRDLYLAASEIVDDFDGSYRIEEMRWERLPRPGTDETMGQLWRQRHHIGDEVAKTGTVSSIRTDAQLEIARFHTEPPQRFWPRNLSNFAMTNQLQIRQHDY